MKLKIKDNWNVWIKINKVALKRDIHSIIHEST